MVLPGGPLHSHRRRKRNTRAANRRHIELAEIELALGAHPQIRQAVVTAHQSGEGCDERQLVAYVVVEADGQQAEPNVSQLRQWLRGRLPDYMLPTTFMLLESLP